MNGRRWDTDERGEGIASGAAFSPNLQELADEMRDAGWVAEEPGVHLLPHLEAACAVPGSRWTILRRRSTTRSRCRCGVDRRVGSVGRDARGGLLAPRVIAEPTSHIRQRMVEDRVEFEMATGTLPKGRRSRRTAT